MTSLSTSAATTLWATPSKEWTIQPKPKPGRKPKKETSPAKDVPEADAKVRRVQNRAAQRAFRERKQSQLAELQARIQSYEQGEIERNIALQNIAKRLKDENEQLRRENQLLKEKIATVERERQSAQEYDKKRARDSSPSNQTDSTLFPAKKKSRPDTDIATQTSLPQLPLSYVPSPSMVSTPESNRSSDSSSSLPYDAQQDLPQTSINNLINFSTSVKAAGIDNNSSFVSFSCGFCSEDTPCVCQEIALQHAADRAALVTFKAGNYGGEKPAIEPNLILSERPTSTTQSGSILENLPPYQPPVPLRRKARSSNSSIFPIHLATSIPPAAKMATCSGDPSNCLACADDPFGKAFCSAIEESITSRATCSSCPCQQSDAAETATLSKAAATEGCCEGRSGCRGCLTPSTAIHVDPKKTIRGETIPTNEAWRQIKAHPNVAFTDLSLLADVVVSHASCSGPRVEVSSTDGLDKLDPANESSTGVLNPGTGLLTNPPARYKDRLHSGASPPPQLVPQEVLIQCGRRRIREVHADAVRDALRLLDAKFS